MAARTRTLHQASVTIIAGLILASCTSSIDFGRFGGAPSGPVISDERPDPDQRGVITYSSFEVAVAERGETVRQVAERLGQDVEETAALNGINPDTPLRSGELIVLPGQSAEISGGPLRPRGTVDIETLASDAIDDAAPQPRAARDEPQRHRVREGDTAASIAARYGVSEAALADWNGLGADRSLRVGQTLLIPSTSKSVPPLLRPATTSTETSQPGEGTEAPPPPSSVSTDEPAQNTPEADPVAPEVPDDVLILPVQGNVIRTFEKGVNDGMDIAAAAGTPVVASADGTVAAITRDTEGVPIMVIRHADGLLTVYAGISDILVERGDSVTRGQQIAQVRAASPSFVHFETRRGFESVDPSEFLN